MLLLGFLPRLATLCVTGLVISGCAAVPVPLQMASWAADGVSYMLTQKSVLDHGLSAMNGQDCAVLRLATEGTACRDAVPVTLAFASGSHPTTTPPLAPTVKAYTAFTPTRLACDAPRVASGLPSDRELYRCAELLIYKDGHAGALNQSERRIASFTREQDAGGVTVWTGVRQAVINLSNVAQVPHSSHEPRSSR